jgi:ATP-dependent Clp protease ATP-binding subunit ClpA
MSRNRVHRGAHGAHSRQAGVGVGRDVLRNLDRNLKMVVFGQERGHRYADSSAIKMARSGLGNPDKPIGCFLFAGPTGVGKTEVTRQLAMQLGIELIRFDMSEYMEPHSVSGSSARLRDMSASIRVVC